MGVVLSGDVLPGSQNELAPIKPFSKFLSVKAIVFFLGGKDLLSDCCLSRLHYTYCLLHKGNVATALQNWLICLEMLVFAIAHKYAFSYKEYVDVRDPTAKNFLTALFDSTVPVDFIVDMQTFKHTFQPIPCTQESDNMSPFANQNDTAKGGLEVGSSKKYEGNNPMSINDEDSHRSLVSVEGNKSHLNFTHDNFSDSSSDAGSADQFLFGHNTSNLSPDTKLVLMVSKILS